MGLKNLSAEISNHLIGIKNQDTREDHVDCLLLLIQKKSSNVIQHAINNLKSLAIKFEEFLRKSHELTKTSYRM